ncbi:MAG: sigma-54 interaction domain-containing protein [Phycisphaerae bacterium]
MCYTDSLYATDVTDRLTPEEAAGIATMLSRSIGSDPAQAARAHDTDHFGEMNSQDIRDFFSEHAHDEVRMVGRSEGMQSVMRTIRLVAQSNCNPILILGQTGTGKELAAQTIHAWRTGNVEPFVAVNCAALTANLLESELFGHVRGSFTGAAKDKVGLFEAAGKGTIFLDEISEMPLELQAKLLRVLQEHTFRRVGDTTDRRCEATIVASSNRDLLKEAHEGTFRKDLYYRLAVLPIKLPALGSPARREDVPVLAQFFVEHSPLNPDGRVRGLTGEALRKLCNHDWPGNVRELKNVIDRAMILEPTRLITPVSLVIECHRSDPQTPAVRQRPAGPVAPSTPERKTDPGDFSLETAEKQFIVRALQETGWQRTRAADLLGITRATLHNKIKRYEITPPDKK